jgi:peptidoglycan/xylan/chitin deacetylase (PgdA/CDA1 family)
MAQSPVVAILTYHALDASGSVLSTPPELFDEQMRILADSGTRVVPLSEVRRVVQGAASREPAIAITFDDGFRSVYERGLPPLARHGFPATVFLVTQHCGMLHGWPGRGSGGVGSPLLDWREIRAMAQTGITFGSHSLTHPDLRRLDAREVERQMVVSKQTIEDALGTPVEALAYPYGAYDARVKDLARAHFKLACATTLGFVNSRSDLFALERLDMYYFRRPDAFRRLFSADIRVYVRLRRWLRACRGWFAGPAG